MGKQEQVILSRYKKDENKVLRIKTFLRKMKFKGDKNNYINVTVLKRGRRAWKGVGCVYNTEKGD